MSETTENKVPEQLGNQNLTEGGWAEKGPRFIAFLIDAVLAGIVSGLIPFIGPILAAAYMLFRDGLNIEFMNQRSLGKKLMKLKLVSTDGSPLDQKNALTRNWTLALGYLPMIFTRIPGMEFIGFVGFILLLVEGFKVISGNERIGDGMAKTKVVPE